MDIMLERILSLVPKKPDGKFVHGALKEFAQTVGLKSGNLISDWINGRSTSYTGYVYEIASKYNVSVEWLRGESDQKEKSDAYSDGLTDDQRKAINKILNTPPEELSKKMAALEAVLDM